MNPILISFLKKTAYVVVAGILGGIAAGLAGVNPAGTPLENQLLVGVLAVLTGLVAAAKRWVDMNLGEKPKSKLDK